jgi:hypothetical protein
MDTNVKRIKAVPGNPQAGAALPGSLLPGQPGVRTPDPRGKEVRGVFVTLNDERYYCIRNVDKIPPFFLSLVSDRDHWIFVASNGGLTAGRVSPDKALFPYVTVDKIYDSTPHTGCKTLLRVEANGTRHHWEPFNREHDGRFETTRNLYKSIVGNKLLFEEINHDLNLGFRYAWACSDTYGFVRQVELENLGRTGCRVDVVDGFQNILPAGTPRTVQASASYLVDAYKWSELDESTGLAQYTLFSGISDRAEPRESLRANTVFCLGLDGRQVLLSTEQLDRFRRGESLTQETQKRGLRGAYLINAAFDLAATSSCRWLLVANVEQSQADTTALIAQLGKPGAVAEAISRSVAKGSDALARIAAASDGLQKTAEENVSAHHFANVMFNILRGGIVNNQYWIPASNFVRHVRFFNRRVFERHRTLLQALPEEVDYAALRATIEQAGDLQLLRVSREFLPITFGRRHGDPSRPWNEFSIKLVDEQGHRPLTYQGNWRDIFQNWEALLQGYPELTEDVIAKFVNASTAEGYNPYRISDEGIDWEVEDPHDPWSYVGYWGDHQIIYLLKLLELSQQFHPGRLGALLHQPCFSYANVPYRIKPFAAVLANAKSTVEYDEDLARQIAVRVAELGADGKLLLDADGAVYQVTLLEKLLVALLGKLSNLVVDGGIWLNTQRPEWNDANNALVGQGLSMVTLYYLRRYIRFLQALMGGHEGPVSISREVGQWLRDTAAALNAVRGQLGGAPIDPRRRYQLLLELGQAASRYRESVYARGSFTGNGPLGLELVAGMLDDALAAVDHSIRANRRGDGLFHAYNLLGLKPDAATIDTLYPMLEGQVAVLSSGAVQPAEAVEVLEALFASTLFRADQKSFLLYPDRELPRFLEKNRVPAAEVAGIPLVQSMLARGDKRIIDRDAAGTCRFNADLANVGELDSRLTSLEPTYGDLLEPAREPLRELYEAVFNHKAFTGRSGGMFGFEGLGCIYWHMVAKLLVAIQENFFAAREQWVDEATCKRLGDLYYRVREGMGFNKTPLEFGAYPIDPYSHTPRHAGAQQPGMTGVVKEEILTRLGELGVRVRDGSVHFEPALLRAREFLATPEPFRYLDVDGQWQELMVPAGGLAFTWCQVPVVCRLVESGQPGVSVTRRGGEYQAWPELTLPPEVAREVFQRSGRIRQVELVLTGRLLFSR